MKRRILLFMMTALLSVGAWAQNLQTKTLWTGEQTVTSSAPLTIAKSELQGARIGSQICIYLSLSGDAQWGYNINYYGDGWKSTWSGKGDNLVVSQLVDNDILSNDNPLKIFAQDNDNTTPTCTVTKVTLNYNGVHLFSDYSPNMWNTYDGVKDMKSYIAYASANDLLSFSFSNVVDWGGSLVFSSGQGVPSEAEDTPTSYYSQGNLSTSSKTYIPLTDELLGYSSLFLSGQGYTASSVDLIYKSDVNIASVSTGTVVADKTKALESETVTLTVTPTANYQFGTLTVTDATGAAVSTSGSGNTYTFTMPATAVTVDATFTPTVPTALNTEDIRLTSSVHSPEGDGTVKLWIDTTEENGWDFTIGRPVSSTEFAGVEVKYKQAYNVQMVITYGDNTSYTQSFTAAEGSTNTAYITFGTDKIVKSIKFSKPTPGDNGMIQFQSSSAVRLVGIVGASTYVPASSLTLTYETLMDGGGSSVKYDNEDNKQEFEIKEGAGNWAGWIFTLPIPTTLYKGVNFNMTKVPENGAIEIVYEGGATQTLKLTTGDNIVNFVHGGNITQIKFNVAGTYRMGECSASNTYLAKVTNLNYATYGSVNDAIDYSATSGLKAYIAKVDGNKVKLTEVKKVPANTAVVLYAEIAGTYTLSTTAGATDDVTGNQLHISDGTAKGNGSTIYVLANDSKGVGFYLVEDGSAITAGKAYLEVSSGAPQFIGFGGDTTGINEELRVKSEEFATAQYYDLQGRHVAQPTKGLYIVNGKKVIIK